MAATHGIYEIEGEADAIVIGPDGQHAGRDITIQNLSGYNVYLGGQGVNSESFGYRLSPNAAWSVELRAGDHIYAYCGSNASVAVFTLGLESFNG